MENKDKLSRQDCHTEPDSTGALSQSPGPGLSPLKHVWRGDNKGAQATLCSAHHADAFQLRQSDRASRARDPLSYSHVKSCTNQRNRFV